MQVLVRDNNVDQALKALKKKMQREGIFREMKLRGHYEKPSEKKAREKAEAIRRARKLARKRMQREGLLPMKPKVIPGAGPGGARGARAGRASDRAFRLWPGLSGRGRAAPFVFRILSRLALRLVEERLRRLHRAVGAEILVPAAGKRTNRLGALDQGIEPLARRDRNDVSRSPWRISTGAVTFSMRRSERNWSFISQRTGTNG